MRRVYFITVLLDLFRLFFSFFFVSFLLISYTDAQTVDIDNVHFGSFAVGYCFLSSLSLLFFLYEFVALAYIVAVVH